MLKMPFDGLVKKSGNTYFVILTLRPVILSTAKNLVFECLRINSIKNFVFQTAARPFAEFILS